jgi:small subunit ribosomal protein S4
VGALDTLESRSVPQWIEINKDAFEGTVKNLPVREDITMPIQEQLIVELYSGAK